MSNILAICLGLEQMKQWMFFSVESTPPPDILQPNSAVGLNSIADSIFGQGKEIEKDGGTPKQIEIQNGEETKNLGKETGKKKKKLKFRKL